MSIPLAKFGYAAAQSIQIITLDIPDPEWNGFGSSTRLQRVNSSLAYNYLTAFHIVTVSDSGANSANDVTGLLYTPDLELSDPCVNASAPWVPRNVTRQSNLPNKDFNLIGIAPWISTQCTLNWFRAAQQDPIRGFIFFMPDADGSGIPPDATDSFYDLGDSEQWKIQNDWPVYMVPTQTGLTMINASAAYSGNMTEIPYGNQLAEYYDSRDYVRLFVDINTGSSGNEFPTIWVFLLVVLGILAGVVALTTVALHWLNRRRRDALRRRVATGEVDLEALGIKRLVVPQRILSDMPLYTYGVGRPVPDSELKEFPTNSEGKDGDGESRPASPSSTTTRPRPALLKVPASPMNMLQQPTCAICLDDFVLATGSSDGTVVRELPCGHIFHPECIDSFLRDTSSLCPICKKSTLPIGYCPKNVTNAMVRRERIVRRIRERVSIDSSDAEDEEFIEAAYRDTPVSLSQRWRDRTASSLSQLGIPRRSCSTPALEPPLAEELIEISPITNRPQHASVSAISATSHSARPPVQPPSTPGRREWARQRAEAMLGRRPPPPDPDDDEETLRKSAPWRMAVRGIFPFSSASAADR